MCRSKLSLVNVVDLAGVRRPVLCACAVQACVVRASASHARILSSPRDSRRGECLYFESWCGLLRYIAHDGPGPCGARALPLQMCGWRWRLSASEAPGVSRQDQRRHGLGFKSPQRGYRSHESSRLEFVMLSPADFSAPLTFSLVCLG